MANMTDNKILKMGIEYLKEIKNTIVKIFENLKNLKSKDEEHKDKKTYFFNILGNLIKLAFLGVGAVFLGTILLFVLGLFFLGIGT